MLSKLVRLSSGSVPSRPGRGRQTSSSSPSLRNLHLSPTGASPVTSRQSPGGSYSGRAVKQLALSGLPMENIGGGGSSNKPSSPLAVPLEPPQLLLPPAVIAASGSVSVVASSATQSTAVPAPTQLLLMSSAEVEFRKPLLPPPAAAAALRQQQGAAMAAAFREQVGQYLPKFTNRRGRQNRSRAKNLVVGRQLLQQQPRQLLPLPDPQQLQLPNGIQQLFPHHQITILNTTTAAATPMTIFATTSTTSGGGAALPPHQHYQQQQELILTTAGPLLSAAAASSLSPPQISIASPALSPVRGRDTPSPTPSLSALMDLSFSESLVNSHHLAAAASLATPPKTGGGGVANLTFLSDILSEDTNSLLHTPPRPSTPSRPPSRYLTDSAGDLSLSSWALSFDSPLKGGPGVGSSGVSLLHSEDSQTSIISTSSEVICL